jgi:hypothetical protein
VVKQKWIKIEKKETKEKETKRYLKIMLRTL